MGLNSLSLEELELMSYADITYMLLKENKKSMNTADLFKKICELLDYSESTFADKIGDYYTSLTIDKRFLMLANNEWDLRDNHSIDIVMDEDEDEEEIETEEVEEDELDIEPEEEDTDTLYDDESDLTDDDDLDDLSIVDEEDISEE